MFQIHNKRGPPVVYFSDTAQIPYRYGLDELPADITVRELLYFFSFDHEDKDFIRKKSRFSSYRVGNNNIIISLAALSTFLLCGLGSGQAIYLLSLK